MSTLYRLLLIAVAAALLATNERATSAEPTATIASAEPSTPTASQGPTTLALAATVRPAQVEADRNLTENLLTLTELEVQSDEALKVVERRQIDLVIQEMVLDQARSAASQLRLGKLLTADVIVLVQLLDPEKDSTKRFAMLRVVDAKTASVRGATVAGIDERSLEDTARQFSRFISTVVRAPQKATVTVAVAPFESAGRFDRLRPLELGIRDLITARLLALSGAAPAPAAQPATQKPTEIPSEPPKAQTGPEVKAPLRFQVLQRSNLDQLLRELDLIQSGLSDKSRLPTVLPTRQASYFIRGTIDEHPMGESFLVIVRGEMIHAQTAQAREKFEFECSPGDVETRLAAAVDQLVKRLLEDRVIAHPSQVSGVTEVQSLKAQVFAELRRMRRRCPIDFTHREFRIPGDPVFNGSWPRLIRPDTELYKYTLRKSIDRLESILFLRPDDAVAAYALAYCYSMHSSETYRPDRADELFRKAYSLDPSAEIAALSLRFLGEIAFDEESGRLDPRQEEQTRERYWFAFEHMPDAYRDHRWARILQEMSQLYRGPERTAALAEFVERAAPYAERGPENRRRALADNTAALAIGLANRGKDQPALAAKGLELLQRWADGEDKLLAESAMAALVQLMIGRKDHLAAAETLEAWARRTSDTSTPAERNKHDHRLTQAAKNYRLAGQTERALKLLLSYRPPPSSASFSSLALGYHGYEIGASYEALGQPDRALAAYVRTAEDCPGVVHNSDIVQRIAALGGVPLREDRDVDVRYLTDARGRQVPAHWLATDGSRIYVADWRTVHVVEPTSGSATLISHEFVRATAVAFVGGELWVGTAENGLWRWNPNSKSWSQFGTEQGLPDKGVVSLTAHGDDLYAGIGTTASGGLVRIDRDGHANVYSDPLAPHSAPTHVVVTDRLILARTMQSIHEWSAKDKTWTIHQAGPRRPVSTPLLFAGKTAIWASTYRQTLALWDATDAENEIFKETSYPPGGQKAGVLLDFVAERGDDVWFGGAPWEYFVSAGLYRFNLKTGSFYKFGPRDGFKSTNNHRVEDGFWLGDRLWLATSAGLCVVTPRK